MMENITMWIWKQIEQIDDSYIGGKYLDINIERGYKLKERERGGRNS